MKTRFPLIVGLVLGIFAVSGVVSEASAGEGVWSKKNEVNILLDKTNNIRLVTVNGKSFAVEMEETSDSLAEIAPAAGDAPDADIGSPTVRGIQVVEDTYLE